jgi:hypothetical protein
MRRRLTLDQLFLPTEASTARCARMFLALDGTVLCVLDVSGELEGSAVYRVELLYAEWSD